MTKPVQKDAYLHFLATIKSKKMIDYYSHLGYNSP